MTGRSLFCEITVVARRKRQHARLNPAGARWRADEMVYKIGRLCTWLWRPLGDAGEMPDVPVQKRRNGSCRDEAAASPLKAPQHPS